MKKLHQASMAMAKGISLVKTKAHYAASPALSPHPTIRQVQTPALDPAFTRLYLASLIGRQRS